MPLWTTHVEALQRVGPGSVLVVSVEVHYAIAAWGECVGLGRDDLSFLTLSDILCTSQSSHAGPRNHSKRNGPE